MQSYVSSELTHFVGRREPDDDARYSLLLRILRGGELVDPRYLVHRDTPIFCFDVPTPNGVRKENFYPDPYFEVRLNGPVLQNEFVAPEMVCFCDIPVQQLTVHTAKYSRFGLGFKKEFLIAQGANPVFYVARNAATPLALVSAGLFSNFFDGEFSSDCRAKFFERLKEFALAVADRDRERWQADATSYKSGEHDPGVFRERLVTLNGFMLGTFAYVFGYLKTFDPSLKEDDADNYYMEREWRVLGRVTFQQDDITRVLLPPAYIDRLQDDEPSIRAELQRL
jgi:hypothetical protein